MATNNSATALQICTDAEQKQLRELTRQLLGLINAHGPRSEEVRGFIMSQSHDGFEDIALMIVLLAEEENERHASHATPADTEASSGHLVAGS